MSELLRENLKNGKGRKVDWEELSERKKRERNKGAKNICKSIIAENFLAWENKQASRSRKHREFQTGSTQRGPTKTHCN